LHQVGDLFELNVKLWCQKVNYTLVGRYISRHSNCSKWWHTALTRWL